MLSTTVGIMGPQLQGVLLAWLPDLILSHCGHIPTHLQQLEGPLIF
jgi:hypothetical protein